MKVAISNSTVPVFRNAYWFLDHAPKRAGEVNASLVKEGKPVLFAQATRCRETCDQIIVIEDDPARNSFLNALQKVSEHLYANNNGVEGGIQLLPRILAECDVCEGERRGRLLEWSNALGDPVPTKVRPRLYVVK